MNARKAWLGVAEEAWGSQGLVVSRCRVQSDDSADSVERERGPASDSEGHAQLENSKWEDAGPGQWAVSTGYNPRLGVYVLREGARETVYVRSHTGTGRCGPPLTFQVRVALSLGAP